MLFRLLGLLGIGTFFAVISAFTVSAGDNEMTEVKRQNINWVFCSDQVMGGKSQGKAEFLSNETTNFVRLQGNVTTANNGGFLQIRTAVYNLEKELEGLLLKVRGNGQRYYVFVRTSGTLMPWQYYKADFPTEKNWAEVKLQFKDFVRSSSWLAKTIRPASIKSIGIVAFGRDHNALIDVADLQFF
jgi:hypothetical protein